MPAYQKAAASWPCPLWRAQLYGVLHAESPEDLRFTHDDEDMSTLVQTVRLDRKSLTH